MGRFPFLIVLSTTLMLGGCGVASQRPTKPMEALARSERTFHPQTGLITESTTAELTGDENAKGRSSVSLTPDGVTFNTSGSNKLEWSRTDSSVVFWAGIAFIALGLGLLYLSANPIGAFVVDRKFAFVVIACGGALVAVPYVADAMRVPLMVGGFVAVVLGGVWVAKELGWFSRATGPEAQKERLAKGDRDGAATLAYVNSHGDKAKARSVKAKPRAGGGE